MAASARIVTISKTIGVIGKEHQGVAQVQNVMMVGVTLNNLKFAPQPEYAKVKNYPYSRLIGYNGIRSIDIIKKL